MCVLFRRRSVNYVVAKHKWCSCLSGQAIRRRQQNARNPAGGWALLRAALTAVVTREISGIRVKHAHSH